MRTALEDCAVHIQSSRTARLRAEPPPLRSSNAQPPYSLLAIRRVAFWTVVGWLLSVWLLASATTAGAAGPTSERLHWVLEPARTEITFSVGATLHTVDGTAELARGELWFDSLGGEVEGEIVIDARSLDTENERRDRNLHEDVLESESHPEIALRNLRFDGDLSATPVDVAIAAELVLQGRPHPVSLQAKVERSDGSMTASTSFEVPYVEWGLENPSRAFLRVKKVVDVQIVARGPVRRVESEHPGAEDARGDAEGDDSGSP